MKKFQLAFCPDPDYPKECSFIKALEQIIDNGKLKDVSESIFEGIQDVKKDNLGNCHNISMALFADLKMAGYSDVHWKTGTLEGTKDKISYEHSWVELDGWVLDFRLHKQIIMDKALYYRMNNARNIRKRDNVLMKHFKK